MSLWLYVLGYCPAAELICAWSDASLMDKHLPVHVSTEETISINTGQIPNSMAAMNIPARNIYHVSLLSVGTHPCTSLYI